MNPPTSEISEDPSFPAPVAELALAPPPRLAEQFVRYAIVGGVAFLVDFACLAVTLNLAGESHYQLAGVVGFLAGVATNYLLSIVWVFDKRSSANVWVEFGVFLAVGIVGMGLNALILWLVVEGLATSALTAKVFAAGVVLIWNFTARKLLLFS